MTRQGTWILLLFVTWYLAGMFRTLPLTVLLLTELGLLAVMALLSVYFHGTLDAAFPSETAFGEKDTDCPCRVSLHAHGRLPVGRPRLTLALSYRTQRRKTVQHFYGGAAPRQETEAVFYVRPPYCGPLDIALRQIETWDYLFLFPAKRRKAESMTLAVLPPARVMRIAPRTLSEVSGAQAQTTVAVPLESISPETRDLREYRPGDSARSIHWKLSARTGQLWSRDYEEEREERFTLRLEFVENPKMRPEHWDAFYEVLSALILGLLCHRSAVRVFWRDGERDLRRDVTDEQSRKMFFLQLYNSEAPLGTPEAVLTDFTLDTNLLWKRESGSVWQFHSKGALREIVEKTFVI